MPEERPEVVPDKNWGEEKPAPAAVPASVIDAMPDALLVLDLNGVILSVNPAFTKMLGYKPEDRIGKSFAEFREPLKAEDIERFTKLLGQLIETGNVELVETVLRAKDGRKIPMSIVYSIVKDAEGNPKNIIAVLRDITELKRLQEKERAAATTEQARAEELEKARQELKDTQDELMVRHQAIETSTGGIAITDRNGNLIDVNWSLLFLWGYREKEDVIGKVVTEFWAEESAEQVKDLIKVVEEEGSWEGELMGIRKDAIKFWVDVNASLLLDKQDNLIGMTYFFTDITERKRTEEKMRETSKMSALGQFVAGAAHEINNPLSIITMVTQDLLLRLKEVNPERLSQKDFGNLIKDLEMINKQGMRCGSVTQSLLAFGRREKDVGKVPTSINEVLEEVLRMAGHQLELSKIKVIDKRIRLPLVLINTSRMSQVFMNIILNACQAMPHGGRLEIESEEIEVGGKSYARLEITDTGEGITKGNLARVFEPFFTTREVGAGAGLGLSIAYSIIKEHGGDIDIESELWKGTKVTVTLPVA